MMKVICTLVAWCVLSHCVTGQNFMGSSGRDDLFSATSSLEELLNREGEIVRMVDKYLQAAQERLDTIRSYVQDYRQLTGSGIGRGSDTGMGSVSSVVKHPIDAYLLLKRLTVEWGQVEDAMTQHANATSGLVQRVLSFREHSTFPDLDDLHGAAVALVRLQDTYRLNMTTLPTGAFTGVGQHAHEFQSVKQLNARDCLFLGKHAFNKGYYDKAIEWFEAALDLTEGTGDSSAPKEEIQPFLTAAMNVHDDILEKRGPRGVDWQTNPVPMDKTLAKKMRYSSVTDIFLPKLYQHQTDQEEEEHYTRLCRGEKLRPASMESVLVCRYSDNGEGYLLLMPLQLEEMSLDPYIVVMHNFLSEAQTQSIIDKAKPRLAASRHRGPDGGFVSSMVRTSKNAWLREADSKDDLMSKITKKVEKATGLEALAPSAGEDYQVANYGIGGLYVTHTDYLMINPDPAAYLPWEHFIGDRYATFMVYLSDVEAGGATVFPRAGVTIWPKRGSAAFWWNLYRTGTGDENTRHGACPVLHGSKWISNKWIHYNDQFLKHNCGLSTWDKLSYP